MKPNISEQLARIAITAAAAMCGAVFSMSTAQAQTWEVTLNSENLQVTVTGGDGTLLRCCQAIQSADESLTSPSAIDGRGINDIIGAQNFVSNDPANGLGAGGHTAVYNLSAVLNASFDYDKPWIAFRFNPLVTQRRGHTPALRVAGITGGTVDIDVDGLTLSVDISDLTNFVGRTPIPAELSYQWEMTDGTDINNATLQTYTAASGATAQVQITDRAALSMFAVITATADVVAVVAPSGPTFSSSLDKENLRITTEVLSTGGRNFQCCFAQQSAEESLSSPELITGAVIAGNVFGWSPNFISGVGYDSTRVSRDVGAKAVYNVSVILNASFDYSRPWIGIQYQAAGSLIFAPAIRVAGIASGEATVNEDGLTLSVNISNLINAVGRAPQPYELSFEWQNSVGVAISGQTMQTYTAAEGATVQVKITDKTGLKTFAAIVATAEAAPVAPAELTFLLTLNTETQEITSTIVADGGERLLCCVVQISEAEAFTSPTDLAGTGPNNYSPNFTSGVDYSGAVVIRRTGDSAVYDVGALLNASFDYSKPWFRILYRTASASPSTPIIRIAGIASGTVGIDKNLQVLSVDISGLTNVVGRTPIPEELTFQWQTRTGSTGNFADASGVSTLQTYTLTAGDEGQVLIQDKAKNGFLGTVTLVPAAAPDPGTGTPPASDSGILISLDVKLVDNAVETTVVLPNEETTIRGIKYQWYSLADGDTTGQTSLNAATLSGYTVVQGVINDAHNQIYVSVSYFYSDGGVVENAQESIRSPFLMLATFAINNISVSAMRQSDGESVARNVDATLHNPGGVTIASTVYQWLQGAEGGTFSAVASATAATWLVPSGADLDVTRPFAIVSVILMVDDNAITITSAPVRIAGSENDVIVASTGNRFTVGAVWGVNFSGNDDIFGTDLHESYYSYEWQAGAAFAKTSPYTNIAGATSFSLTLAADNINAATPFVRVLGVDIAGLNTATLTSDGNSIANPTQVNGTVGLSIVVTGAAFSGTGNMFQDNNGLATLAYQWELARGEETRTVAAATVSFANGAGQIAAVAASNIANYTRDAADFAAVDSGGTGAYSIILSVTHTDPFGFTMSFLTTTEIGNAPAAVSEDGALSWTGGVSAGSTMTAVVDALVDPDGTLTITYQWQGQNAAGTWADLVNDGSSTPNSTASLYVLPTSGWDTAVVSARFIVTHTDSLGDETTLTSGAGGILRPTQNNPTVDVIGGGVFEAGETLSVNITAIMDANGNGTVAAYQWLNGNNSVKSGATSATYTLTADDATNGTVKVSLTYADALGYQTTFTATATGIPPVSVTGTARIDGSEVYSVGNVYTANTDGITGSDGAAASLSFTYQWYVGGNTVTEGMAKTYTLASGVNPGTAPATLSVQITPIYTSGFTGATAFGAALALGDDPTSGTVSIDGELAAGETLTANISQLSDANGTMTITYQWFRGTGAILAAGETSSTYEVTDADIASGLLSVAVTFVDGIGISTTRGATIGLSDDNFFTKERTKQVGAILTQLERVLALDAIGAHLDSFVDGNGARQSFAEINNVRVDGKEDLAHALATRAAKSRNIGKNFALDSFSYRIVGGGADASGAATASGADASGAASAGASAFDFGAPWSAWASGGWITAEGAPVIGGKTFKYEGDAFGLYGGYDRQFGRNILAGVAVSRTDVDLKMDLSVDDSDILDGKVGRQMNSILPYVEWQDGKSKIRLIGGLGVGDFTTHGEKCNATADSDWLLAAASGSYSVWESRKWAVAAVGDLSYATSDIDSANCDSGGEKIEGATSSGGEWVAGGRLTYNGGGDARGAAAAYSFAPQIGLDARQEFGDLENDMAYDLSGAMSFAADAGRGFSFRLEGKTQLNKTTHQRDTISGRVDYKYGNLRSSLQTDAATESELSHRLEFGYAGVWGMNSLGGNLYMERGHSSNSAAKLGAEVRLDF